MSGQLFMPLWTDAYLGDTHHFTTTQHGAYLLILIAMWRNGGTLPNNEKRLAATAGLNVARWRAIKDNVMEKLDVEGDVVTQKRLQLELKKSLSISAKRADAGKAGGVAKSLKNKDAAVANGASLPEQPQRSASAKSCPPTPTPTPAHTHQEKEGGVDDEHVPFPSDLPPDPGQEIEFENGVVKVTAAMLSTWTKRYPNVNVIAKIETLATWINSQCRDGRKDWKELVATMLKKDFDALREREMQLRIRAESDSKQASKPKLSLV